MYPSQCFVLIVYVKVQLLQHVTKILSIWWIFTVQKGAVRGLCTQLCQGILWVVISINLPTWLIYPPPLDAYASQGLTLSLTESPSHWVTQSHRWKPICVSVSTPLSLFLIWTLSTLSLHYLYSLHYLCRYQVSFFLSKQKCPPNKCLPKKIFHKEILANKIFAEKEILPNNIFLFFIGAQGILDLKSCLI